MLLAITLVLLIFASLAACGAKDASVDGDRDLYTAFIMTLPPNTKCYGGVDFPWYTEETGRERLSETRFKIAVSPTDST